MQFLTFQSRFWQYVVGPVQVPETQFFGFAIIENTECELYCMKTILLSGPFATNLNVQYYCRTRPLLANVKVVAFRKGDLKMYWRESHNSAQIAWKSSEFLLKALRKKIRRGSDIACERDSDRGITEGKRADIAKKLGRLMPEHHRKFWDDFPTNETSVDLIDNIG